MALVDFTNATITLENSAALSSNYGYLSLYISSNLYNSNGSIIVTNCTINVVNIDTSGWQIIFTGQFTANGTELYTWGSYWHITNISFSSGDTYSFAIQCDITT